MRKLLLCLFSFFCLLIVWDASFQDAHSRSAGSPGGYSGSPSDANRTCVSCHAGPAPIVTAGLLTSNIPADGYTPGNVYTFMINADYHGKIKYGFELSANNTSNTSIGGFIHTTTFTKAVNGNSVTHTNSGTSAPSGSRSWTVNWTAPALGSGKVNFYVAVNASNNSGSNAGDTILRAVLPIEERIEPCNPNDVGVTATSSQLCQPGSTTIMVANSETGISYQLKNADTDANVGAAQTGDGTTLIFNTGTISTLTMYKVVATKNALCSFTLSTRPSVNVSANTTPIVSVNGITTICKGDSVMLISTEAQSYQWTSGQTTRSIWVKSTGSYGVTTNHTDGCSFTSSPVFITVSDVLEPRMNIKGKVGLCQGDSLILSTDEFNSYTWSTGQTTRSIVVKTPGTYTVRVANSSGCIGKSPDTVFVEIGTKPNSAMTIFGKPDLCEGDSVRLSVPGGSNYLWSTGAVSNTIVAKTTGNYWVRIGAGACIVTSDTVKVRLHEVKQPVLNETGVVQVCAGDSVLLETDTAYYEYRWSNGATTRSIYVSNQANYFVLVTDSFGCFKFSATTSLIAGTKLHPPIKSNGPLVLCPGKNVELSTSKYSTYQWSNGSTDSAIVVTQPGKYYVFVSSQSGCSGGSDTIDVKIEPAPTAKLSLSGFQIGCDSLLLEASTGSATYTWNNGKTGRRIYVTENGMYYCEVTSPGGCMARSDSVVVIMGKEPKDVTITLDTNVFFSSAQYGNQWYRSGTKLLGDTLQKLILGSKDGDYYTVILDDLGICSDTSNVIKVNRVGVQELYGLQVQLYPNPAGDKFYISGITDYDRIEIYSLPGTKVMSADRQPGNAIDVSSLAEGSYIVRIFLQNQVIVKHLSVIKHD
ncbi:MAG: choice-of-anchor V domain-containing protein [Bacteroidota bacterium]